MLAMAKPLPALMLAVMLTPASAQQDPGSWSSVLRDSDGRPVAAAQMTMRGPSGAITATTDSAGVFRFDNLSAGRYTLAIQWNGRTAQVNAPIEIRAGERRNESVRLTEESAVLAAESSAEGTGGEQLSSRQVSALPLNKRDFSQLLLLAAGTQTDTNGAANFTQQFTMNGQRGTATVFAMDGIDTTDPEMGGATFSNFNVDAIQEIKSNSGVMPATIGHGAAGYTEVVTKSGGQQLARQRLRVRAERGVRRTQFL